MSELEIECVSVCVLTTKVMCVRCAGWPCDWPFVVW